MGTRGVKGGRRREKRAGFPRWREPVGEIGKLVNCSKALQTIPDTHNCLVWSKPSYTHAHCLLPVY